MMKNLFAHWTLLPWLCLILSLSACETTTTHPFVQPARDWQTRSGQLLYHTAQTTLIGEVVVRFSRAGDFELTFSKGPGLALLSLRQDAGFVEVKGAMAQAGWAGPVEQAPEQLRGWLQLRERILRSPKARSVRYASSRETFIFRF